MNRLHWPRILAAFLVIYVLALAVASAHYQFSDPRFTEVTR